MHVATNLFTKPIHVYSGISSIASLISSEYRELAVADLEGVPRVPWYPLFGFSFDKNLWKPGLQQNPTI